MSIKIEKDKPIPEGRKFKYPWSQMNIGDSFLADSRHAVWASVMNYNKKMRREKKKQIKISTQKQKPYGCRVWRIE
jgi:hypothetical protein